jgi:hypothetical protein
MLEASCVCTQVVTSLAAGFFGCKSASVLAPALPVSGHLGIVTKMTGVCPSPVFQYAPSSKKLCHSIDVCRGIVHVSESFVKVMALGMRQDFAQKLLQWRPSCAIVRSCDDRPQPRDIAQVGADAQCIRKRPGRHGDEIVREVALKLSRSRHLRCNDLESLGRAELQKAAAPTHHMNLTLYSSQDELRSDG